MRVLLRRYRSGEFFRAVDDWTTIPTKAFNFVEKERALEAVRELRLSEVDLVVVNDDGSLLFGTRLTEAELGTNGAEPEPLAGPNVATETQATEGKTRPKHFTILVAEDLDSDAQLLRMAFKRAGVTAPLSFVRDGAEAIEYLGNRREVSGRTREALPAMFLLDLKMPRVDGFEVLEWVRGQSGSKRLVVIVLTASELRSDVNRAYDLGANSYLVKPNGFDGLESIAHSLRRYWLDCNRYPDCLPVS